MIRKLGGIAERLISGGKPAKIAQLGKSVSPAFIRNMQANNLRYTLRHAATHSSFYRERLGHLKGGFRGIKHPAELGDFFTSSKDLAAHPSEAFLCGKPNRAFETTGSTGKPKRIFFSNHEFADMCRWGSAGLWDLGVRPSDRVVSAFDFAFWIPGITIQDMLERIGAFHVVASKIHPKEIVARMDDYHFNVILADPSWIIRFTELMRDHKKYKVKLLLGGGEHVPDDVRKRVEDAWGADMILSYGSTEAGGASCMECLHKNGYHLNEVAFYFEIINPDKEGYGEIVFTTLVRETMPLIRYRTGDVARFITGRCACGMPTQRISKIRGRKDDMVVLGAGNLFPWIFEEILRDIPQISADWQVAVKKPNGLDCLEFRVEKIDSTDEHLTGVIKENIQERFNDIWKNYSVGMCDLKFTYHNRGDLRAGRKIKRLVDERTGY
ncbi:MAG TPA: AMP-binding protein [bacterium]|nr:AMP-binding protein [bacterium]